MKLKDINKEIKKTKKEIETISKEIYQLTEQLNTIKNNKNFNLWNAIIPIIKTNILGGICTSLYVTTTGYNINYMPFIFYDSCISSFPDYYDLKSNVVFKESVAKISKEINIRTEKVKTLNDKLEKLLVEQKNKQQSQLNLLKTQTLPLI